jgi:hypothetical protein
MRLAMEHHIALMLYIHPYHADYLEMVYDLGMWPSFEAWKRVLVDAVERITHESPGDIRIFDFSGFDEFTTEVVPPSGDRRSAMRWYWEPGHYKSALGEYILAAILHGDSQFGRLITSMNIESVLADIREQRNRFVSQRGAGNKESKTSLDKK